MNNPKTEILKLRVTPQQYADLAELAEIHNLTLAEYLRQVCARESQILEAWRPRMAAIIHSLTAPSPSSSAADNTPEHR